MRLLHCSDFHGNARWFDWLVEAAVSFDLVCLTGDHLDLLDLQHIEGQIHTVKAALGRITTPVALCSGNNDAFSGPPAPPSLHHAAWLSELRRRGVWVDGDAFEIGGIQARCIAWNAPLPAASGGEIWLYHAPPAQTPLAVDQWGGDSGDEILGEVCRAGRGPGLLLCGHQHAPRQWFYYPGRTWCLNPGCSRDAAVPNHIVVNTTRLTVELVGDHRYAGTIHLGYPA